LYIPSTSDKPVIWVGSALEALRDFPADARRAAGYELRRVQMGMAPSDGKPLTSVGSGVYEIRIHTRTEHRVIYVAKFEEAVYVLHGLQKKTQRTKQADLTLARERFGQVQALRQKGRGRY